MERGNTNAFHRYPGITGNSSDAVIRASPYPKYTSQQNDRYSNHTLDQFNLSVQLSPCTVIFRRFYLSLQKTSSPAYRFVQYLVSTRWQSCFSPTADHLRFDWWIDTLPYRRLTCFVSMKRTLKQSFCLSSVATPQNKSDFTERACCLEWNGLGDHRRLSIIRVCEFSLFLLHLHFFKATSDEHSQKNPSQKTIN